MSPGDDRSDTRRFVRLATATGAVVTFGGYQSRVVDQCYRLPIFARMKDDALYAADPFVRAFDTFNPHWGYGKLVIGLEGVVGESAAIFGLHVATLALTLASLWRIRGMLAPSLPWWSDWLLVAMFALCRAGNIGTNHLWEDHLLDRQIGYALLWLALAEWIGGERRRAWSIPALIGATAFVHPGLGVLAAALWSGVFAAGVVSRDSSWRESGRFGLVLVPAMLPWAFIYLPQSKVLMAGADPSLFWSLATELQGPQHMRPVHWRASQWWSAGAILAAGAAGAAVCRKAFAGSPVRRAGIWTGLILAGLLLATLLIEKGHSIGVALAQPFRLATPVRGLCLIGMIPYIVRLIQTRGTIGAARAGALIFSLRGDRAFTAAFCVECALWSVDAVSAGISGTNRRTMVRNLAWATGSALACWWLIRRDTAGGEVLVLAGNCAGAAMAIVVRRCAATDSFESFNLRNAGISKARAARICAYSWVIPCAAACAGWADPSGMTPVCQALAGRWRILEIPVSDSERLAVAARSVLPTDAVILAPPRDKAFRHWSRRSVVVNVAGSPYQAEALAAWAERLRVVAGEPCDLAEFARRWPENRVAWESYYEKAGGVTLDAWARRFGATAIVTKGRGDDSETLASLGWHVVTRSGPMSLLARSPAAIADSRNDRSDGVRQ